MMEAESAVLKADGSRMLLVASAIVFLAVSFICLLLSVPSVLAPAFGLCVALLVLLRFEWFLYGQVLLLPWYPLLDTDFFVHDVFLVMRFVLFAGVWFTRRRQGKSVKEWFAGSRIKLGILAFACVATLSLLVSATGPNTDALRLLTRLFSYLALFFAISGWLESREQVERVIKLILLSGIAVALFGFYQIWINDYSSLYFNLYPLQEGALDEFNGRITSFLFHYNSLAGYLNLILPLALAAMFLARESWVRSLAVSAYWLDLIALYFTGSRGGLIACAVMLAGSMVVLRPRRLLFRRVLLPTILMAVVALRLPSELQTASSSRLEAIDETTSISRLALWSAAGAMFFQHPVLGVGYGNYRSLYNDYIPGVTPGQLDAHNIYLQFLSETGLIGFATFGLLIVLLALKSVKLARSADPLHRLLGIAMAGALLTTLTHGLVDYLFNVSPQFGGMFWLLMALGVAAGEQRSLPPSQTEIP